MLEATSDGKVPWGGGYMYRLPKIMAHVMYGLKSSRHFDSVGCKGWGISMEEEEGKERERRG